MLWNQSSVTTSHPLLKATPEESETVQMMPCVALRNTAGTSDGRKTASPRPLPAALVVMDAVGTTAAGLPLQVGSNAKMFSVTW